ncbi:methylglyoxal synthase [Spirobacillus cienkowskii]|uniref:methylglyoxal synthase n=1 Tax=Spirobacillus cienkowskii TaxID=495820 RepID=UPI0030D36BFC
MPNFFKKVTIPNKKRIVLIAHDSKKKELIDWVNINCNKLSDHELYATGTSGRLIEKETGLKVTCFESGPLGGDMQAGAFITEGKLDLILFFWDPLESQPHDPDIRALLRIAVVWNVPLACNVATADFLVSSIYFSNSYTKTIKDFTTYKKRKIINKN